MNNVETQLFTVVKSKRQTNGYLKVFGAFSSHELEFLKSIDLQSTEPFDLASSMGG
jgi:hypothetical protein